VNAPQTLAADARLCALSHGGVQRPPFMGMGPRLLRGIAAALMLAIANLALMPLACAVQLQRSQSAMEAATPHEQQYAQALQAIYARVSADALQAWAEGMRQHWASTRARWQAAGIAPDIIQRQRALEAAFDTRHAELMALYRAATAAAAGAPERQALADFLARERPQTTQRPIGLDKLPWQVEPPRPQMPANTAEALQAQLAGAQQNPPAKTPRPKAQQNAPALVSPRLAIDVAQESLARAPLTKAGEAFQTKALTRHTAADLAATLDAPHTGEIKALAQSLGNNPHAIYQWVHDNIHYFPSHGSVQGAQDTLDKKHGNAFDTNSLLIALLRSAGIPARYVYGSVEIPLEQVQNWVGGAATASAAQQVLSQGGVPNAILTRGGRDFAFRLEHVWVGALIQYHPGRGPRTGQAKARHLGTHGCQLQAIHLP